MGRVATILNAVRGILADPHKTRWSDDVLLQFLSEAQVNLAEKARLYTKTISLPVFAGQDVYELPSDVIVIERAYYNGKVLKLVDYQTIDASPEYKSQDPGYIVFNKHPRLEVRLFPAPVSSSETNILALDSDLIGIANSCEAENIRIPEKYGIITDIIGTDIDIQTRSVYGIITDIKEVVNVLDVYYYAIPPALTSIEDNLVLAPACDKALRYHIIMTALLADTDAQNRQSAVLYSQLYEEAQKSVLQDASKNFMATDTQLETNYYNGVFECPPR